MTNIHFDMYWAWYPTEDLSYRFNIINGFGNNKSYLW